MVRYLWQATRPHEWIKNAFVFAPLFFAGSIADPTKISLAAIVFAAFCAVSSAAYLINDVADRHRDRRHPVKRFRPIASGRISLRSAVATAVVLTLLGLAAAYWVQPWCGLILFGYVGLNLAYSWWMKHVVILDVFAIAAGFVLRVMAGGVATAIEPTAWLFTATFLLALFLALAKRRHELGLLREARVRHRPVLNDYSLDLVDALISVVTPLTVITYLLYTLDPQTQHRFNSTLLYSTGIFVTFGIFRYLYLVHRRDQGGSPARLVVKDVPLAVAVAAWIAAFSIIIYLR